VLPRSYMASVCRVHTNVYGLLQQRKLETTPTAPRLASLHASQDAVRSWQGPFLWRAQTVSVCSSTYGARDDIRLDSGL
jgi:hypothetical protein